MQNKLIEILTNIGLNKNKMELFKNSELKKIFIDKKNNKYKILISIDKKIDDNITNEYNNIKDCKIQYNLKKEIKEEIQKEVKEIKKVKQEVQNQSRSDIIFGREINGEVTRIDNINSEINNVIIEGKLFGIDLFESNKSDFKIITLKLTDYTSSIYAKMFYNNKEEFDDMIK